MQQLLQSTLNKVRKSQASIEPVHYREVEDSLSTALPDSQAFDENSFHF
jgi:hypothetical protein